MQSKYEGSCKDCGAKHAIGTEINKNKNGNWCSHGENCQGAMQTQGTVSPPNSNLDQQIVNAKKVTSAFIDLMIEKDQIAATVNAATVWNTVMMRK